METKIVIDASEGVLGRVAAFAAKQSLFGKSVTIVNCNKAIITGNVRGTVANYKQKRARGGSALKGPNFPKSPERLMKRTIRGMLSHRQGRGKEALKRIICYNEVPAEFENSEKISMKREVKTKFVPLTRLESEM